MSDEVTTGRPRTGPDAAVLDTLDDVQAALVLLRRAQDRMMGFVRLPISAFTMAELMRATAHTSEVCQMIGRQVGGK